MFIMEKSVKDHPAQCITSVGILSFLIYRGYVPWRHFHNPYNNQQLAWRNKVLHLNQNSMPRHFKYLIGISLGSGYLFDKFCLKSDD